MIRRNLPLGDDPRKWLLIPQREHARLSYELAAAWRMSPVAETLRNHPELLQAIRQHDCGWSEWEAAPAIDPAYNHPYGFTEMRPADAQRLWSESIAGCRQLGPLAGWVVAGHFIHLQSKQDDDYQQWRIWLDKYETHRSEWLAEWQAQDPRNTQRLAEHGLFLLQTFDWISLWLCCRAPLVQADPTETMELHDKEFAFGPFRLRAILAGVTIDPWPFSEDAIELTVNAQQAPIGSYPTTEKLLAAAEPATVAWKLVRD